MIRSTETIGMRNAPAGRIFSVQRFCLHDGPGIRTTAFLHGCPLSCFWCHNPESRVDANMVWRRPGLCLDCGHCESECQTGAAAGNDVLLCNGCGACIDACPAGAREKLTREIPVAGMVDELLRDRAFFDQSCGGVTFSGGEPLLQPGFLKACLQECRRAGVHTAVDTSAFTSTETLMSVADDSDLLLVDIKSLDESKHREATGVPVGPILENIRALDAASIEVWLRFPLVPGFNDSETQITDLGRFVAGLRRIRRMHVLPCHRLGTGKVKRLGGVDTDRPVAEIPNHRTEQAADILRAFGLEVHVGG